MASTTNPTTPATTQAAPAAPLDQKLSMRYSYGQLDAAHKPIADEIAATIIAYPDIVKLNDPAAQQQFMSDVSKSGIGAALANLGGAGKSALDSIRQAGIPIISGTLNAAKNVNDTRKVGSDLLDGASKGGDIATAPVTIP